MKANRFKLITLVICSLFLSMFSINQVYAKTSVAQLKKKLITLVDKNQKASVKTKKFIKSKLIPQISNPVLVDAVKTQNSRGLSMAEIKKIDEEWKEAEDELEIHKQMMSGPCAEAVRKLAGNLRAIGETFVMDNQGANVCQNELTGDYWQGDEAKWKNSFNNGAGGIDIGIEKLDVSSNIVLQQVSLPIADKKGVVVGAITYGIMTEKL